MRLVLRLVLMLWGVSLAALLIGRSVDVRHGDPARGKILYYDPRFVCFGCHAINGAAAPLMKGVSARVSDMRLTALKNSGESVEQYLAESILDPGQYIVPGYSDHVMPRVYPRYLNYDDLQNMVAYLMTL